MTSRPLPVILMAILLLLMAFPIQTSPSEGQSQGGPVKLSLSPTSPSSQEVIVTPSSNGSATFTSIVQVDMTINETVHVVLSASVSTGWSASVAPSAIPFSESGRTNITVTVIVPAATSAALIGKLTVSGNLTYSNGTIQASTYAVITVRQYYRCLITSNYIKQTDSHVIVDLILTNGGNGLDTFSIDITDLDKLSAKGILVAVSAFEVSNIAPGHNGTIRVNIQYDGDELDLNEHVEIMIKSGAAEAAGLVVVKSYSIFVHFQKGTFIATSWLISAIIIAIFLNIFVVLLLLRRGRKVR